MPAQQGGQVAVFARNHSEYLEYAAERAERHSDELVTFRSKKIWAGAKRAREEQGRVSIYFAVIGKPEVRFKAILQDVLTQPQTGSAASQRLLAFTPPGTDAEALWGNEARTLYAISSCYKLEQPFPLSHLHKAHDHTPLSTDYKYSYALVEEIEPYIRDGPSPDTALPPLRVEATITRIVRDTQLVYRLKDLYKDTCQICRTRLELSTGRGYSEGHHMQPLGAPHNGPDKEENIIIVCPNCHALLDRCSLPLRRAQLIVHSQHALGDIYIEYHNALQVYNTFANYAGTGSAGFA